MAALVVGGITLTRESTPGEAGALLRGLNREECAVRRRSLSDTGMQLSTAGYALQ